MVPSTVHLDWRQTDPGPRSKVGPLKSVGTAILWGEWQLKGEYIQRLYELFTQSTKCVLICLSDVSAQGKYQASLLQSVLLSGLTFWTYHTLYHSAWRSVQWWKKLDSSFCDHPLCSESSLLYSHFCLRLFRNHVHWHDHIREDTVRPIKDRGICPTVCTRSFQDRKKWRSHEVFRNGYDLKQNHQVQLNVVVHMWGWR